MAKIAIVGVARWDRSPLRWLGVATPVNDAVVGIIKTREHRMLALG
jgi:hypothetical protein